MRGTLPRGGAAGKVAAGAVHLSRTDRILLAYATLGVLYWAAQLVQVVRVTRWVPMLRDLPERPLERWPRVSAVVCARDERDTIEEAVRSRMADDYPNLELVLVDDRSTDGTGEIIDALAAEDGRVKTVHIGELPEGWLGKLYAMHSGVLEANGEWLLFSDADVHVKPGTLKKLVAYCEEKGIDHLPVIPDLDSEGFVLESGLSVLLRLICMTVRLWAIEDERSDAAAGAGAFTMVRRAALDRTPGIEWLRLEVVDDVALGQMLKAHGGRCSVVNGRNCVSVTIYRSIHESMEAGERPAFVHLANFNPLRATALALSFLGIEISPLVALVVPGVPYLKRVGSLGLAVSIVLNVFASRWTGHRLLPSLVYPVGSSFAAFSILRAGWVGYWRKGISWRGTFYPVELLREGKRLKLV